MLCCLCYVMLCYVMSCHVMRRKGGSIIFVLESTHLLLRIFSNSSYKSNFFHASVVCVHVIIPLKGN
jgi:hypothetical protein